jgi:hypothetical protein
LDYSVVYYPVSILIETRGGSTHPKRHSDKVLSVIFTPKHLHMA